MSLREVGIAVLLLTPGEYKVQRTVLCASQACFNAHAHTWLSALHSTGQSPLTENFSITFSACSEQEDTKELFPARALCTQTTPSWQGNAVSPVNEYIDRWSRSIADGSERQCFRIRGLAVRCGYSLPHVRELALAAPLRFRQHIPAQVCHPHDVRTTLASREHLAIWDGKWLWLHHNDSKCVFPCLSWSMPLTSTAGADGIASQTGVLRIQNTEVSYYPVVRDLRMKWDTNTRMRIACIIEQARCADTRAEVLLWMSNCGCLWRTHLGCPHSTSTQLTVDNLPNCWGRRDVWCRSDRLCRSWSCQRAGRDVEPASDVRWVCLCGASTASTPSTAFMNAFNLHVERLCLRTESTVHSQTDERDLSLLADDLSRGDVTFSCDLFHGGVVCFFNAKGETKAVCVSRTCKETWLSAPAGKPLYNARGECFAYIDQGGHLVFVCLKSQTGFSKRIAIPSLHGTHLVASRIRIEGEMQDVLITSHSNVLGSTWRPSSAPACPIQLKSNRWKLIPPKVPYLTCCTWSGEIVWCLELPCVGECLLIIDNVFCLVGTTCGIFEIDAQNGILLDCLSSLSATTLVGCKTTSKEWTLAGKTDAHDHFIISFLPKMHLPHAMHS